MGDTTDEQAPMEVDWQIGNTSPISSINDDANWDEYIPDSQSESSDAASEEIISLSLLVPGQPSPREQVPVLLQEPELQEPQVQPQKESNPQSKSQPQKKKPTRPCVYCGKFQTRLTRHLKRMHIAEDGVSAALQLPAIQQRRAFSALKKEGIYSKNVQIQHNEGSNDKLLRERKQGSEKVVMCSGCKGFFSRRRIHNHKKFCQTDNGLTAITVAFVRKSQNVSEEFQRSVLDRLREDTVGMVCRKDMVVLLLGQRLWAKSAKKDRRVIMNEMRLLGNLIVKLNEAAGKEKLTGEDVLHRVNFDFLTQAIDNLTKLEGNKEKSGLKLSIGYLLKKAVKVMKGHYVQHNMLSEADEVQRFSEVLTLNWDFMFYSAQLHCELRRNALRQPDDQPLEQDVVKLRDYVLSSMTSMTKDEYLLWDVHSFVVLRNLIVTRLTMFNARRGGEPARMTLKEWQDAEEGKWIDPDLVQNIADPLEKSLMNTYKLAYQSGKGSRRLVPVLIPNDTVDSLQKLIEVRGAVNIPENNIFLFPNTGQSLDHVSGWHCINSVSKTMGGMLMKPNLLIADKFRHRASTVFALQDIPEQEREVFYRHMGHSGSINRDVYQCPLAVMEVTRVGGFLQSLDIGGKHCSAGSETLQKHKSASCINSTSSIDAVVPPVHSDDGKVVSTNLCSQSSSSAQESLCDCESSSEPSLSDADTSKSTECSPPISEPGVNTRTRKRSYHQWSSENALKVTSYFSSYVKRPGIGSKGPLPGVKDIEHFLDTSNIFSDIPLEKKQKISLIKTKVFNERTRFRGRSCYEKI